MLTSILTDELPAAHRTNAFVREPLAGPHKYIHKWSGEERSYKKSEICLPASMNIYGRLFSGIGSAIGIGGTRSPTVQCFRDVHETAKSLASLGVSIVSGGVPGVDLASHLGAIDSERPPPIKTIAVLANPAHMQLDGHIWKSRAVSDLISQNGLFLSEYKDYAEPESIEFKERLLMRDRIISGISDLFIAFECSEDSATVDTAKRAVNQGKKVYAFHTHYTASRRGTEQLIDEGIAAPVKRLEDILNNLEKTNDAKC